jgi:predicted transcriptional regulator
MLRIARGEKPNRYEPRVWVSSLDALLRVLTRENMLLIEIIRNSRPQSVTELASLTNRAVPNVSRTLHGLERLGIVKMKEGDEGKKIPVLLWCGDKVELNFEAAKSTAA